MRVDDRVETRVPPVGIGRPLNARGRPATATSSGTDARPLPTATGWKAAAQTRRDGAALIVVGGCRGYTARHGPEGPMIAAAGLPPSATIVGVRTARLAGEG